MYFFLSVDWRRLTILTSSILEKLRKKMLTYTIVAASASQIENIYYAAQDSNIYYAVEE
jgi:hypothetical protein